MKDNKTRKDVHDNTNLTQREASGFKDLAQLQAAQTENARLQSETYRISDREAIEVIMKKLESRRNRTEEIQTSEDEKLAINILREEERNWNDKTKDLIQQVSQEAAAELAEWEGTMGKSYSIGGTSHKPSVHLDKYDSEEAASAIDASLGRQHEIKVYPIYTELPNQAQEEWAKKYSDLYGGTEHARQYIVDNHNTQHENQASTSDTQTYTADAHTSEWTSMSTSSNLYWNDGRPLIHEQDPQQSQNTSDKGKRHATEADRQRWQIEEDEQFAHELQHQEEKESNAKSDSAFHDKTRSTYINGQRGNWVKGGKDQHVQNLDALETKEEKEQYIRDNTIKHDKTSSSLISRQRHTWVRSGKDQHVQNLEALETKEEKEQYIRDNIKKRHSTSSSIISTQRRNWVRNGKYQHVQNLEALETKEEKEQYIRDNIKKR